MTALIPRTVLDWFHETDRLPALSIRQPWAWLITAGPKDVENRTWRTNFRGLVLIHAGLKWDDVSTSDIGAHYGIEPPRMLATGGIVGWARITDCVVTSDSPWFHGPYGFLMPDRGELPFVPYRGRLGFFKASPDIRAALHTHIQPQLIS